MFSQSSFQQFCSALSEKGLFVRFNPNASTASIDIKDGVITLPVLDFLEEDSSILLASHECGHAIFSDYSPEEIIKYKKKYGSLLNVLEDARVDRKIKLQYKGLMSIFERGYNYLHEQGFFSDDIYPMTNEEASALKFIDRINLACKVSALEINFTKRERELLVKAYVLDTKEDVLNLCEEIYQYLQENPEVEFIKPKNFPTSGKKDSGSGSTGSEGEAMDGEAQEKGSGKSEGNSHSGSPSGAGKDSGTDDGDGEKESPEKEGKEGQLNPVPKEELTSETQNNFERNLNTEYEKHSTNENPGAQPFEVSTSQAHVDTICSDGIWLMKDIDQYMKVNGLFTGIKIRLEQAKKAASIASAKFNRKITSSAAKSQRFKLTGTLNMSRLAHYKTSQNLFKRKVVTKGEQNHAMIIGVDFSSSMRSSLPDVLFQCVVATEFCNMNGIPFEVYGYGCKHMFSGERVSKHVMKLADSLHYSPTALLAISERHIARVCSYFQKNFFFSMWMTPTDRALISMYPTLRKYKNAGIEKTIVLMITDGMYNVINDRHNCLESSKGKTIRYDHVRIDNRLAKAEHYLDPYFCEIQCPYQNGLYVFVNTIIGHMKETFGCMVVFSHIIAESRDYRLSNFFLKTIVNRFNENRIPISDFVLEGLWNKDLSNWKEPKDMDILRIENVNNIDACLYIPYHIYDSLRQINKTFSKLKTASNLYEGKKAFEKVQRNNNYLSMFANLLVEKF